MFACVFILKHLMAKQSWQTNRNPIKKAWNLRKPTSLVHTSTKSTTCTRRRGRAENAEKRRDGFLEREGKGLERETGSRFLHGRAKWERKRCLVIRTKNEDSRELTGLWRTPNQCTQRAYARVYDGVWWTRSICWTTRCVWVSTVWFLLRPILFRRGIALTLISFIYLFLFPNKFYGVSLIPTSLFNMGSRSCQRSSFIFILFFCLKRQKKWDFS